MNTVITYTTEWTREIIQEREARIANEKGRNVNQKPSFLPSPPPLPAFPPACLPPSRDSWTGETRASPSCKLWTQFTTPTADRQATAGRRQARNSLPAPARLCYCHHIHCHLTPSPPLLSHLLITPSPPLSIMPPTLPASSPPLTLQPSGTTTTTSTTITSNFSTTIYYAISTSTISTSVTITTYILYHCHHYY